MIMSLRFFFSLMKGVQDVQNSWENKIIFFQRRKHFQGFVMIIICRMIIVIHLEKVHWAREWSSLFSNKEDLEWWVSPWIVFSWKGWCEDTTALSRSQMDRQGIWIP